MPTYFWVFFPAFIVLLWAFIGYAVSCIGGWHSLSIRFKAQSEPYGETRTAGLLFYTVRMRFRVKYNNVIRLTAAEDALYFSVLFLFRAGHPPLRIPWNEIQMRKAKFLCFRFVDLTLGNQERIPMRITERMARNLGLLDRLPC